MSEIIELVGLIPRALNQHLTAGLRSAGTGEGRPHTSQAMHANSF